MRYLGSARGRKWEYGASRVRYEARARHTLLPVRPSGVVLDGHHDRRGVMRDHVKVAERGELGLDSAAFDQRAGLTL